MIPDKLRRGLPEEITDAEIVGLETAAPDESCRLYGPPGTGKSTQSAFRTATRGIEEELSPRNMTVVTYRKALASVVRERLIDWGVFAEPEDVAPGSGADENPFKYWNTVHAVASRAAGFHEMLPDSDEGGMVDPSAEYEFCREMGIRRTPHRPWEETKWTVFKDLYDYGKQNLLDIGDYRWIDGSKLPQLRSNLAAERRLEDYREEWGNANYETVAAEWERFKAENEYYDFFEQLEYAIMEDLPPLSHLVIDEYHDTTPLMAEVMERWIDAADVAIVAGDPDQVVNSYAGASPRFFERLPERVDTDLPEIRLKKSWRCPDEHFIAAARVLREQRKPPSLQTAGSGVFRRWVSDGFSFERDRDRWSLPPIDRRGEPVQLWMDHGPDIMYLTRTQRQADGVAAALDRAGILYESQSSVGGDWEYRTALMNALELVEGMDSEDAEMSNRELSNTEARALLRQTPQAHLGERPEYIGEQIHELNGVELSVWVRWTGDKWWRYFTRGRSSIDELTKQNKLTDRDFTAMKAAWVRYEPPYTPETDTRVLTIHASKGAEASDVVVYDGIPNAVQEGMDKSDDLRENEARTWYVALTRASEQVHIVRDGWEWADPYLPADLEPRAAESAQQYREAAEQ